MLGYEPNIKSNVCMRLNLSTGAPGNFQELNKLLGALPFKPFGNIGHYRNSGTLNLIAEAKITGKPGIPYTMVNLTHEYPGVLPGFYVFEFGYRRHAKVLRLKSGLKGQGAKGLRGSIQLAKKPSNHQPALRLTVLTSQPVNQPTRREALLFKVAHRLLPSEAHA